MKKMKGYFLADLRQLCKSGTWLIGIIGVAGALFFSLETGNRVFNENVVSMYTFASEMSGALLMYVFCAFPYGTVFSDELEHKYVRYRVVRGSQKGYVLSKAILIYASSVLVMLGGTLAFLLLCRIRFSWGDWQQAPDLETLAAGCYGDVLKSGNGLGYCMLYALHLGLLAGMLSLFAAFCSIHISNRVLVLVMPVVLYRILLSLDIRGYNVLVFEPPLLVVFPTDWQNLLFVSVLSLVPSFALTSGIYLSIKKKL